MPTYYVLLYSESSLVLCVYWTVWNMASEMLWLDGLSSVWFVALLHLQAWMSRGCYHKMAWVKSVIGLQHNHSIIHYHSTTNQSNNQSTSQSIKYIQNAAKWDTGQVLIWVTAPGFRNPPKMSCQCLCVFTLWSCNSESRQKRAPEPCVYTVCFLCGHLGACEGRNAAVRDQSNITIEQWGSRVRRIYLERWWVSVGALQTQQSTMWSL